MEKARPNPAMAWVYWASTEQNSLELTRQATRRMLTEFSSEIIIKKKIRVTTFYLILQSNHTLKVSPQIC